MDTAEIKAIFEQKQIRRVKLGVFDIDGVLRGKYISLPKFWSALKDGVGFCDVIFGWDSGDRLYNNVTFTGWHTGYPDLTAKLDATTMRIAPWERDTALFLLDLEDRSGRALPIAPRQVLKTVVARAQAAGYTPKCSVEYEFFFFRETPESLRAKNYRELTPLTPGMFGYSVVRASANADLVHEVIDGLAEFDVALEGFHTETGPGVYEAAIAVDEAVRAADKAALFKTAVKEIAARHGLIATFMAKWNAGLPGCSGHVHQSLWNGNSTNLFYAVDTDQRMSAMMASYIAGLVQLMPELMAMVCPTINSYKRSVPGTWAPVNATWGVENRTAAVRAIPGSAKSTRVEFRLPGADSNPYLAVAASLAAGLYGIEKRLQPPPACTQNAYEEDERSGGGRSAGLPRTLAQATERFRASHCAREIFGADFVGHYAATREWEVRQFEAAVTDWELERYFEVI